MVFPAQRTAPAQPHLAAALLGTRGRDRTEETETDTLVPILAARSPDAPEAREGSRPTEPHRWIARVDPARWPRVVAGCCFAAAALNGVTAGLHFADGKTMAGTLWSMSAGLMAASGTLAASVHVVGRRGLPTSARSRACTSAVAEEAARQV